VYAVRKYFQRRSSEEVITLSKVGKRHSMQALLTQRLGRVLFDTLQSQVPDRRFIVKSAALLLNSTEEALLEELAAQVNLPFVRRIPALPVRLLSMHHIEGALENLGFTFLAHKGEIHGICCIDPASLNSVREEYSDLPIYLATWTDIQQTLKDAKEELHKSRESQSQKHIKEQRQMSIAALELLVERAVEHGARTLRINFEPEDSIVYGIVCADGREGRGTISKLLKSQVVQIIEELQTGEVGAELSLIRQAVDVSYYDAKLFVELTICSEQNVINLGHKDIQGVLTHRIPAIETSAKSDVGTDRFEQISRTIESIDRIIEQSPEPCSDLHAAVSKKILIVDDNKVFRKVLESFLNRQGLEAVHAESAEAALEIVRERGHELLLMISDLHMPGKGGRALVEEVRAKERFVNLPIVILTSDEQVDVRIELFQSGADACFMKSEDPRILCAQIGRLVQKDRQLRAA
jgi:CheY-like chemotaxis protein